MTGISPLQSFQDQGYVILRNFFSKSIINYWATDLLWFVEVQMKRLGIDLIQEEDPVLRLSYSLNSVFLRYPEVQSWIYEEVNRRPWVFSLASDRMILEWAKYLLQTDHIGIHPRLNMIMSMPNHEWHVAYWHQDRFYGYHYHLVTYIPFQSTDSSNGGLIVAPGQHKNGLFPHVDNYEMGEKSKWLTIDHNYRENIKNAVQLDLSGGDLMFFDGFLPHSASINRSRHVRFALNIRYTNLEDPFFVERGWRWQDLAEAGAKALARKEPPSTSGERSFTVTEQSGGA